MAENQNLSLRFESVRSADRETGTQASIYVDFACSYLKDSGAPVLTAACRNAREFEREAARLKGEIDAILEEARRRFGETGGASSRPRAAETPTDAAGAPEPAKQPLSIRRDLLVRDRMTRDVKTLRANDEILVAEELMKVGSFRHVVVVDDAGAQVVGVLSHSDICFNALAWNLGGGHVQHDRIVGKMAVKQVMQNSVATIRPDASLAEAAQLMVEKKINCLPVTDNDRLVGVLTTGDFLAMWSDALFSDGAATEG